MNLQILQGDCRETLKTVPDDSIQACVTSPPYWGLRSYLDGEHEAKGMEIGCESTPEEYVANMVAVFREVRRSLRLDGTLWLNLGDCYATGAGAVGKCPGGGKQGERWARRPARNGHGKEQGGYRGARNGHEGKHAYIGSANGIGPMQQPNWMPQKGLKPKDIVGMPWRVAFALQADGWWLRGDNIWGKPNGMPESVTDRPTRSHEYVFQLTKSADYFYDYEAVRLPPLPSSIARLEQHVEGQLGSIRANGGGKTNGAMKAVGRTTDKQRGHSRRHDGFNDRWDAMEKWEQQINGAALRSVWWISPAQCDDAHFAVMPNNLAAVCIMASSSTGDTILDPFGGSGTTGQMAIELGRKAILCELNPDYIPLIEQRTNTTPGLGL